MTATDDLLSKVEQAAGKEHIPCPICGHQTWFVDEDAPMIFLMLASARSLDASISGDDPPEDDVYPGSHHFIRHLRTMRIPPLARCPSPPGRADVGARCCSICCSIDRRLVYI